MTHERHDRTGLAAHEPRCEPSTTCHRLDRCARFHATLPLHGATVVDYSIQTCGGTALCPGLIDVSRVQKPVQVSAPVKPWPQGVE